MLKDGRQKETQTDRNEDEHRQKHREGGGLGVTLGARSHPASSVPPPARWCCPACPASHRWGPARDRQPSPICEGIPTPSGQTLIKSWLALDSSAFHQTPPYGKAQPNSKRVTLWVFTSGGGVEAQWQKKVKFCSFSMILVAKKNKKNVNCCQKNTAMAKKNDKSFGHRKNVV